VPCDYLNDRLHGYLDDELDAAGAAEFERHLGACPDCCAALSEERELRSALANARLYERAPASLRNSILARMGPTNAANGRAVAPAANWKWLAIAALLLLAVTSSTLGWNWLRNRGGAPEFAVAAVDAHLRSLQQGHLADVPSTDQHTVKPWFDGRVDFAPKVADFSAEGFPLIGGRLDVVNGKTVAALVYGRRKHIVNVFVGQQGSTPRQSGSGELQGYHWLAWQASGFEYVAVSDAAAADLDELRALFAKE
jgi:mycothiol system anti-sigma-R factor